MTEANLSPQVRFVASPMQPLQGMDPTGVTIGASLSLTMSSPSEDKAPLLSERILMRTRSTLCVSSKAGQKFHIN